MIKLIVLNILVYPVLLQSTYCYMDDVDSEIPLLSKTISKTLSSVVPRICQSELLSFETLLLNQVLSFNPHNFILAVDLWCCLCR